MTVQQALARLLDGHDLSREEARAVMNEIMEGEATPAQIGGFLVALRLKGETADETARLPCFATPAPAAAATRAAAVEMLIVRAASPPVPAVSTRSSRFGCTESTCVRIASAQPAISFAVSPFSRSATRKPPI